MTDETLPNENAHPTLWTVHIEGPDEIHHYDTETEAREVAQACNVSWQHLVENTRPEIKQYMPNLRAVVVPPLSEASDDES